VTTVPDRADKLNIFSHPDDKAQTEIDELYPMGQDISDGVSAGKYMQALSPGIHHTYRWQQEYIKITPYRHTQKLKIRKLPHHRTGIAYIRYRSTHF
jgi:hypothetical protein